MVTAPTISDLSNTIDVGPVTLFSDFLARGGRQDDRGLVLFEVDDDRVIPSCFLQPGKSGLLWPLVRDINMLYLGGTAIQKYRWWTTKSIHLGGRAPIDFVDDLDHRLLLIGMARNYRPFDVQ